MRKVLNFIEVSDDNINNSAFYLTKKKIIIFGFNNIGKILNNLTDYITSIDIIITNLNDFKLDEICCPENISEVNIIFPNKKLISNLLKNKTLYKIKSPNEVKEYYLKEYEENKNHPSYGYHFIYDNDNLFYSNTILNNEILEMFKNKKVYYLYQNISQKELQKLKNLIKEPYRKRVTCICNNELNNLLDE